MNLNELAYGLLMLCVCVFIYALRRGTDGPRHWISSDTPDREVEHKEYTFEVKLPPLRGLSEEDDNVPDPRNRKTL